MSDITQLRRETETLLKNTTAEIFERAVAPHLLPLKGEVRALVEGLAETTKEYREFLDDEFKESLRGLRHSLTEVRRGGDNLATAVHEAADALPGRLIGPLEQQAVRDQATLVENLQRASLELETRIVGHLEWQDRRFASQLDQLGVNIAEMVNEGQAITERLEQVDQARRDEARRQLEQLDDATQRLLDRAESMSAILEQNLIQAGATQGRLELLIQQANQRMTVGIRWTIAAVMLGTLGAIECGLLLLRILPNP